jgi:hypothetical protein
MGQLITDDFSQLKSAVRFKPTTNIRFIAEELRRYGIKTNQKTKKDSTIFYQSAHIICHFFPDENTKSENEFIEPKFSLVSFKDLFKLIGKNKEGSDDQDIVRVWEIASRLEERSIIDIQGTASEILDKDEDGKLPKVFANLDHVHKKDDIEKNISYQSKFASNKKYKTIFGSSLVCI